MKTVKDYKDAGLVFIEGDNVDDSHENDSSIIRPLSSRMAECCNKGKYDFDSAPVGEFAWRTNTGVKPDYVGEVEVMWNNDTVHTELFEMRNWTEKRYASSIAKWRPLITKEQPKESESPLSPDFVDKPIYTQAMCDAGEFPVIGSSVEVDKCGNIYDYEVLFVSNQYFIGTDGIHEQYFHTSSIKIKPLRPDTGKLRDTIASEIAPLILDDSLSESVAASLMKKFTITLNEDEQMTITEVAPVTLTDGRAYQFAVGGRELNGIYREYDKSFYNYLGDIEAVKITNIQPLTLREGR